MWKKSAINAKCAITFGTDFRLKTVIPKQHQISKILNTTARKKH